MATATYYETPPTADELDAYNRRSFNGARVEAGLYLQPADDGKTLFAIGKFSDGAWMGLDPERFPERFDYWTWGRVDKAEYERLVTQGDAEQFVQFIRDCADHGGWFRSKRDATAAALNTDDGEGA